MGIDVECEIILCKSSFLDDWYTIERLEHDNQEWHEQTGPNSFRFHSSERLSSEACIEGNSHEMLEIANAILKNKDVSFRRVGISIEHDGVHFFSPKNSYNDGIVSFENAEKFANEAIKMLSRKEK